MSKVARVIIPEDVIREMKGKLYLGSKELEEVEKKSLQQEAKALESMRLWSILNESIKQLCFERGWRDSTTIEHLNVAKSMYSVLEVQRSIVQKIKEVV